MVPGVVKAAYGSTEELEETRVEVWRTGNSKARMGASAWTSTESRGLSEEKGEEQREDGKVPGVVY